MKEYYIYIVNRVKIITTHLKLGKFRPIVSLVLIGEYGKSPYLGIKMPDTI
jgi:hypothetical protein